MGDAGPLTPPPAAGPQIGGAGIEHETSVREVTVLVTGFGVRGTKSITPLPLFPVVLCLPGLQRRLAFISLTRL